MEIREIREHELEPLLRLYTQLHENPMPVLDARIRDIWARIRADENHHIIVAEEDGELVSTCVIVLVPNLTHGQRPYAFIENVVTHPAYRCRGLATACLDYAAELARRAHCYKIMLLTGSKLDSTLQFYERAGYDRREKTAFIQRME